jgi:hypothetical protein
VPPGVRRGTSTSNDARARGRPAAKTPGTFVSRTDNTSDGKLTATDFERQARESFERLVRLETVEQTRVRVHSGPRGSEGDWFLVNG